MECITVTSMNRQLEDEGGKDCGQLGSVTWFLAGVEVLGPQMIFFIVKTGLRKSVVSVGKVSSSIELDHL